MQSRHELSWALAFRKALRNTVEFSVAVQRIHVSNVFAQKHKHQGDGIAREMRLQRASLVWYGSANTVSWSRSVHTTRSQQFQSQDNTQSLRRVRHTNGTMCSIHLVTKWIDSIAFLHFVMVWLPIKWNGKSIVEMAEKYLVSRYLTRDI